MSHDLVRRLTAGENEMVASVFGPAVDPDRVRIHHRKWFPLQPRNVVMAPSGDIHFHPRDDLWCDDFSAATLSRQGLFIHEMTHVWQAQTRGRWYLPLMRHPFCRYKYTIRPGWPLERYGIEQQAEIVRHAFLLREGRLVPGAASLDDYRAIMPFIPPGLERPNGPLVQLSEATRQS